MQVSVVLCCLLSQVDLLPLCINSELTAGQLPLLASLRKFIVKSVGIPEPDREAAMSTATQVAALLTALAAAHRTSCGSGAGGSANADVLVQHAVVQLLPALQVSLTVKSAECFTMPCCCLWSTNRLGALRCLVCATGHQTLHGRCITAVRPQSLDAVAH